MLFLIATPLGNLKDITLRALDVLREVDTIACEDTRTSLKLLTPYGIEKPLLPYHEHNAEKARPRLLKMLKEGKKIAYITDAGLPLISDPGFKLVTSCQDQGLPYTVLPGPSAPLTALCLSGLSPAHFYFAGFLPPKSSARLTTWETLASLSATLIAFESSKRLVACLKDALTALGDRKAAVCREMTKLYEEVQKAPLSSLIAHYTAHPPRGEIVLVIEGAPASAAPSPEKIGEHLTHALTQHSLKEAVDLVSKALKLPRREVYQHALTLKSQAKP